MYVWVVRLFLSLSVWLSICLSVCLSICLTVFLSISLYVWLCLSVYLSVYPSMFVLLSLYDFMSVCLSAWLPACLSPDDCSPEAAHRERGCGPGEDSPGAERRYGGERATAKWMKGENTPLRALMQIGWQVVLMGSIRRKGARNVSLRLCPRCMQSSKIGK